MHIGIGNFHRAHQAWYTSKSDDWKITGVVMTNSSLHDALAKNDNRYLLGTWGASGLSTEIIDVYDDVFLATEQEDKIVARIADEETHVITLTITEKGYSSAGNPLNLNSGPIALELQANHPKSAIGILADGLIARFRSSGPGITVISCDNLSENGKRLKQAVLDFLLTRCPEATSWVDDQVAFPCSMVDRITPRLSENTIEEIHSVAGFSTMPTVGTERFSEWIIEDDFVVCRPSWDIAGAVFVSDVASFEKRKLRLLNGAHSYLAYAGLQKGYQYVHEAMSDPELVTDLNAIWDEASSTVAEPAIKTVPTYRSALLERLTVPEMRHELEQIAMDGSIKVRERFLPVLIERRTRSLPSPMMDQAIEAWARFVVSTIRSGKTLYDPNKASLETIVSRDQEAPIQSLISKIKGEHND